MVYKLLVREEKFSFFPASAIEFFRYCLSSGKYILSIR
jgi:hypothetical protein